MTVHTFLRPSKERIAGEMGMIVDTIKIGIKNVILKAFDYNITPEIEIAVRSRISFSGHDLTVSQQFQNVGNVKGILLF